METGGDIETPILSAVVATYNRLPELRTMLDSLLPQILGRPVEVLIVDDCSTDSTWEWLRTNLAGTPGVRCLRMERNGGPGSARNLGLASARGRCFVPIDSDFIVPEGAIDHILQGIRDESRYHLLFFPNLHHPAMRRLDSLAGRCEITYESFVTSRIGELLPVAHLDFMRANELAFPNLRAGGESLLWMRILAAGGPALFLDTPVMYYRTDAAQRICTLEYQLNHPGDLAAIHDAMAALFCGDSSAAIRSARGQSLLAAGTYHLLSGNMGIGRSRLVSAVVEGCWQAAPTLAASFGGSRIFSALFRFYRAKLSRAYLR